MNLLATSWIFRIAYPKDPLLPHTFSSLSRAFIQIRVSYIWIRGRRGDYLGRKNSG